MKSFFSFFLVFFYSSSSYSQHLTANYEVIHELYGIMNGEKVKIEDLKSEGFYFWKDSRIISFIRPTYLANFPKGYIERNQGSASYSFSLVMDTIQDLRYASLDSGILRARDYLSTLEYEGTNRVFGFKFGKKKWVIFPDEKEIMGVVCKRATFTSGGTLISEIWFSPDIPTPVGPFNLTDPPGLIFEGEYFTIHKKFKLKKYSFEEEISDNVFWPRQFNEPFK